MVNEEDYRYAVEDLEKELEAVNRDKRSLANAQMSLFGNGSDENLIKWQLDLREDLDRIYHLLKGHQIKENDKGEQFWNEPEDPALSPFNEFGTQLIMNIMSFYLNRNTILSNYDDDMINYKVYDFGYELVDLIFNRYEEMMMTTTFEKEFKNIYNIELEELEDGRFVYEEDGKYYLLSELMINRVQQKLDEHLMGKMKLYPMLVRELIDSIHSAYLRAYHGGERDSLRTARTVTQNEPINRFGNIPMVTQGQQRRSLIHPTTWFRA